MTLVYRTGECNYDIPYFELTRYNKISINSWYARLKPLPFKSRTGCFPGPFSEFSSNFQYSLNNFKHIDTCVDQEASLTFNYHTQ